MCPLPPPRAIRRSAPSATAGSPATAREPPQDGGQSPTARTKAWGFSTAPPPRARPPGPTTARMPEAASPVWARFPVTCLRRASPSAIFHRTASRFASAQGTQRTVRSDRRGTALKTQGVQWQCERLNMRTSALLMLAVFGVVNAGCSFIFTKGPQPEVQPPPPCTTGNAAPVLDTVAAVAVALPAVWSFAQAVSDCPWNVLGGCSPEARGAYWVGAGVGFALAALYTTSAVVGFNRTAACRASQPPQPQEAAPSAQPESSFLLVPPHGCPPPGDAPRICSSAGLDPLRRHFRRGGYGVQHGRGEEAA